MPGELSALPDSSEPPSRGGGALLGGRFALEERLDQGRFGSVYRALDRQHGPYGQPYVAVLIVPPEVVRSGEQLDAFRRQLSVVRTLSHRNIVTLHGFERDGDVHFLVLEWVDGESLRSVLDGLAPETVCERDAFAVVRAVGAALVYGHARGVVHGDVRADNVLVTERGDVKLLYTPACLAPSAPFAIGPADDVRGLAALAYELLSGARPPLVAAYGRDALPAPKRLDGLSRKRWRALERALTAHDGRAGSVRDLMADLDLPIPGSYERVRVGGGRRSGMSIPPRAVAAGVLIAGCVAIGIGLARLWPERQAIVPELEDLSSSLTGPIGDAADGARRGAAQLREQMQPARERLLEWWDAAVSGGGDGRDDSARDAPSEPEAPADGGEAGSSPPGPRDDRPESDAPSQGASAGAGAASSAGASEVPEDAASSDSGNVSVAAAPAFPENAAPRGLRFARAATTVSESRGVARIEIRRGTGQGELAFVWWTRDASAVAGEDYADLGRVVERFGEGEVSVMLYVPIVSDSIGERGEHFEILAGPLSAEGNQTGALRSTRITIVDDDG